MIQTRAYVRSLDDKSQDENRRSLTTLDRSSNQIICIEIQIAHERIYIHLLTPGVEHYKYMRI